MTDADCHEAEGRLEALLSCDGWLRWVSRGLVPDQGGADDLVQDVWLTALRHRPRAGTARAWMRAVAVNLFRDGRRAERRRVQREGFVASWRTSSASPEELAARAQLARCLAEGMERLKDHHRETIALRFFAEQSSAEIARTLRVPPGTVRRRLKEALDHLRDAFAAHDYGRRARWESEH